MKWTIRTIILALLATLVSSSVNAQILTCVQALAATPQGPFPCSVTVAWQDNAVDETRYELQRRLNKSAWATIGGALAPNTVSVIDATLQQSATQDNIYDYRVLAINSGGSTPSINPATVSFTINKAITPPQPATGITVTFKAADGELEIIEQGKTRTTKLKANDGTFTITSAAEITVNYP